MMIGRILILSIATALKRSKLPVRTVPSFLSPFSKFTRNYGISNEGSIDDVNKSNTGDILITGLNKDMDISVKVVSCKEIIQESLMRNNLSPTAAQALGEQKLCCRQIS